MSPKKLYEKVDTNIRVWYIKNAPRTNECVQSGKEGMVKNMELKAAREKRGLTQTQVANKVGIAERAYQNYEIGVRKPSAEIAIRISVALKIKSFKQFKAIFGAATPEAPDGNQVG